MYDFELRKMRCDNCNRIISDLDRFTEAGPGEARAIGTIVVIHVDGTPHVRPDACNDCCTAVFHTLMRERESSNQWHK